MLQQSRESIFLSAPDAAEFIGRDDVTFIDASWYLPTQKKDAYGEFRKKRIPGAVFFDIDAISDQTTDLPHMLPTEKEFSKAVSKLGVSKDDLIIIYDGAGLFSAPRVWWTFKVMGAPDVRILKGGLKHWLACNLPVETGNPNPPRVKLFQAELSKNAVISQNQLEKVVENNSAIILDARSEERFYGTAPEPRKGLRGGHIPGSKSLPFNHLIDNNGELVADEELEAIFQSRGLGKETPIVTTCGSGVTAAILSLALLISGRSNTKLYDGSWSQWGLPDGPTILLDE